MKADSVDVWWDMSILLYRIKSPFDENLKEKFKTEVPSQFRAWDPPTKTWVFEEDYLEVVLKIYAGYRQKITTRKEVERDFRAALPAATDIGDLSKCCTVFVGYLDQDVLERAWKMQLTRLHPDAGGSPQASSDFNSAYQFIKAGRK